MTRSQYSLPPVRGFLAAAAGGLIPAPPRWPLFLLFALVLGRHAASFAQLSLAPESQPAASQPDEGFFARSKYPPLAPDSPYATGDWFGLRTALEDAGLATQFFYNDTYQWVTKGGIRSPVGRNGATIDWFITLDLDKARLVPGGTFLVHARRQWGEGVNPFTGSLWQVADDLDGDRTLHVDQLWYEQALIKDKLWFRTGFLDFQTIVDRNAFANTEDVQFLNLQFDNNPLLPLNIGLGAEVLIRPVQWFSVTAVAGDANAILFQPGFSTAFHGPARFVWLVEPAFHVQVPNPFGKAPLPGNYRFGLVNDPRPRPIFVPRGTPAAASYTRGDDYGFYASFDQMLYREGQTDLQGLGIFFRYGFRHDDINRIENFWSVGFSYLGLVPTRDRDMLGVAVGQSIPSTYYNDVVDSLSEAETTGELYYSIAVTRWLAITPDLQYVASPGATKRLEDAIVLGLRARISF